MTSVHSRVPELFPPLTAEEYELASCVYRLLVAGEPLRREALATELNRPTREVVALLAQWPRHVAYDEWKRIVGLGGLSVEPTRHRFVVNGGTLYAWCAFDTLFLPGLLDCRAEVQSDCAATGESLWLHVSPAGVDDVSHPDAVLSLRVPSLEDVRHDVRSSFCSYSNFFRSRAAAVEWSRHHSDVHVLSLSEAAGLAGSLNARQLVTC